MHIGIIIDHPFEAPLGYSIRPRELSINLAKLGCEVHIFSPVDVEYRFSSNLVVHGISQLQASFLGRLHKILRKAYKSPMVAHRLYRRSVLEMLAKRLADSLYSKVKSYGIEILQGEKEIATMAAVILSKRLNIPVVADIHGLLVEEAVQSGFIEHESNEYVECREFVSEILRESDAVVAVSENLRDHLVRSFGINGEKAFVIPNAGTFREIVRPSRSEPCYNVVYSGILEPWERVDLAIKSMLHVTKVNKKARLLIAGTGSLKGHLTGLVNNLKLSSHISFVGTIPYEKIGDFLVQGDVAVLPSTVDIVRKVACPIKLFDYLSTGLPVVTVEGLWWSDFIKLHNVGLATVGKPKNFADAINELLSDPDKINAMSKNAIKLVREKYNWAEMAKRLLHVYKNALRITH